MAKNLVKFTPTPCCSQMCHFECSVGIPGICHYTVQWSEATGISHYTHYKVLCNLPLCSPSPQSAALFICRAAQGGDDDVGQAQHGGDVDKVEHKVGRLHKLHMVVIMMTSSRW